ncbi:NAD-dependent epimerase/dehydratase family protein [Actinomadura terrae]|uniref:NAD-dependent epimerase/dehydratase family protein n=1 Tax=Actinomadura terrae TaxID=604353 RepID=UPI001FA7A0B2|nr:NAD-dependent epimerase/dehydratase family protein [Actinomadura terrae]
MTRLLVLGGTAFVGRAVVDAALRRGWKVTTFSRGVTGPPPSGAEALTGDRTDPDGLRALAGREWDLVIDTWRDDAAAVTAAARALEPSVGRYAYVSSLAVYAWPPPAEFTEDAPLLDPDSGSSGGIFGSYALAKAGGEHAVRAAFGDRALLARTGLILGPHEYAGRLPWWLLRVARGGRVAAPRPSDLPLQYIDTRDLAEWLLDAEENGLAGDFNVLSDVGHATMASLLAACRAVTGGGADLTWVDGDVLLAHGVRPWMELPIWIPPGNVLEPSYRVDSTKAKAAGLHCRPVHDTVADTWRWLRSEPDHGRRAGQDKPWMTPEKEAEVLVAWDRLLRSAGG